MWKKLKKIVNGVLEKLYPSDVTCFICGSEVRDNENCLCDKCHNNVEYNDKICLKCGSPCKTMSDYCLLCQKTKRNFSIARAPLIYSGEIPLIIQKFKYNGEKYLAKPFAKVMKNTYDEMIKGGISVDLIVYVPLFKERQKKRGYNQSELLAIELSQLIDVPVSHRNLMRVKNTETQTNLSYKERQKNLDKAFSVVNKAEFKNKNVLLIDDVLTTGSTANYCSIILKKAKAKNVYVLTFATTDGERA